MVPCIIFYSMNTTDAAICSQFYSTARFTLHVSGVLYTHHQGTILKAVSTATGTDHINISATYSQRVLVLTTRPHWE